MHKVSVRFSDAEHKKLVELIGQEKPGTTASDVIRDLFRAHYSNLALSNDLVAARAEILKELEKLSEQQGGGSSKEVAEILRIVRIVASTMPAAAKQL